MSGGLITTRAASESNLGEEVAAQLLARSRPLAVAAGVLARAGADSRPAEAVVPRSSRLLPGGAALRERAMPATAEARGRRRRRRADAAGHADAPASIRSSVEVGYALVALVDEKQGGTLLDARARDPPADRRRDRRRRAAGARRRQPAARAARLRDPRQGRRSGARRALRRSPAGDQSRHGVAHRSRAVQTREPAFGLPALWIPADAARRARRPPATPSSIRRRRCRRTCRRRSATFLPDLLEPPADQGAARPASAQTSPKLVEELVPKVVVDRRRAARAAAAAARARAGARSDDDPRSASPTPRPRPRIPTRSTEAVRARDRPRHLPAVPERPAASCRSIGVAARRSRRSCWRRSSAPSRARSWRSTRSRPRAWPSQIADAPRAGHGTARAPVLADAPAAPVAAVRPGAAAPRRAVAQRGAAARAIVSAGHAGLTCI